MPWGVTKRKAVLATFPSLAEIGGGKHPISLMVTVFWFLRLRGSPGPAVPGPDESTQRPGRVRTVNDGVRDRHLRRGLWLLCHPELFRNSSERRPLAPQVPRSLG